ncbi:DDE-type integrase/transposase/recombinase [Natrinema sp. SYSU A 869]|uniref:integrase core domain-containing protein n=1 Tax=Natrinema sp. SYSU A 869 TaxID=2871694 RepID=UPI002104A348|nr:DDE-type integrase/transposase/recombinase [Natrinema sp. SYSU A 869]
MQIDGEWSWWYDAIDLELKLILGVVLFGRHGTDPAAAFLQKLREKHDISDAEFLVDQFGYWTAPLPSRTERSGQLYQPKPHRTWFHTLKIRVDRFHNSSVGSRASVREWLEQFVHYYNHQRPHHALDGKVSVEEIQTRQCRMDNSINPEINDFYENLHLTPNNGTYIAVFGKLQGNLMLKTPCFSPIQRCDSTLHFTTKGSYFDTDNREIGTLRNVTTKW